MKPLGYFVSAPSSSLDSDLLDRLEELFGSQLQGLTRDDKATCLILLVESAVKPQQVLVGSDFWSDHNAEEFWGIASKLSPGRKMALVCAITEHLIYGDQH